MKLSIVIPAYNEVDTLPRVFSRILATPHSKEIILVDDGSTDGTRVVIERHQGEWQNILAKNGGRLNVILQPANRGKGAALEAGFRQVTGDIVIIQDADLEYSPDDYDALIEPILEGAADVVYGSRFAGGKKRRVLFYWHQVANKFLTTVSNMFTNLNLTDMEVGYKAFRREVVEQLHLRSRSFGCEPEMTAKVASLGCRVYEVSISYQGRSYAEGKKIGLKDAWIALYTILRFWIFKDLQR